MQIGCITAWYEVYIDIERNKTTLIITTVNDKRVGEREDALTDRILGGFEGLLLTARLVGSDGKDTRLVSRGRGAGGLLVARRKRREIALFIICSDTIESLSVLEFAATIRTFVPHAIGLVGRDVSRLVVAVVSSAERSIARDGLARNSGEINRVSSSAQVGSARSSLVSTEVDSRIG